MDKFIISTSGSANCPASGTSTNIRVGYPTVSILKLYCLAPTEKRDLEQTYHCLLEHYRHHTAQFLIRIYAVFDT